LNTSKKNRFFLLLLAGIVFSAITSVPVAAVQTDDVRLKAIMSQGPDQRPLAYPTALFYDRQADELYVVDAGNNRLVLFNHNGYPTDAVGRGRGLENIISGMRYEKKLYVCCGSSQTFSAGHISILDNAFFPEQQVVLDQKSRGESSAVARQVMAGTNGAFYVLRSGENGVAVFDRSWKFLRQIVPHYEHLGVREPAEIVRITRDQNGRLYFLSEQWGRIFVYDTDETFLFSFGDKGGDSGKLARARGIAVDDLHDRIYVSDYLRHTVLVYDLTGQWLYEIGGKGTRPGSFFYPSSLCLDGDGVLYVADTFNHRVQIFSIQPREGG
jgi:DNA-binding beta-propeller fold protein YncE